MHIGLVFIQTLHCFKICVVFACPLLDSYETKRSSWRAAAISWDKMLTGSYGITVFIGLIDYWRQNTERILDSGIGSTNRSLNLATCFLWLAAWTPLPWIQVKTDLITGRKIKLLVMSWRLGHNVSVSPCGCLDVFQNLRVTYCSFTLTMISVPRITIFLVETVLNGRN
jgi:hypothetical protein